jgi:hypothetical protein
LRTKGLFARKKNPDTHFTDGDFRVLSEMVREGKLSPRDPLFDRLPPIYDGFRVDAGEVEEIPLGDPRSCPNCCSRIELDGDQYKCVGLKNEGEVTEFLLPNFPKGMAPIGVTNLDPCGWERPASGYGKDWV